MTITEANDVNTLVSWAMGQRRPYGGHIPDADATEAARRLAGKAYKALLTGLHPEDITLDRQATSARFSTILAQLDMNDREVRDGA